MHARLKQEIADLNPGYAAWVMATAIISTGFAGFGQPALSAVTLVIACGAFALLLVGYTWRLVGYPARLMADARDAGRSLGYFSLVAAMNVLAVRFALDHHPWVTVVLGALSVPLWLALTCALPGGILMGHRQAPALPGVNGSWFLGVVATQALATTAATLAASYPGHAQSLAVVGVALWGVGVFLYVMLAAVVTVRVLAVPVTAETLSPTYWIYMGATAITVLAAAKLLQLPASLPVLVATRQVISGIAFLLWAFGTWWVPLLLTVAARWHLIRREAARYDATWWSAVFPLGMYAVASASYGRATHLGFMSSIGRVEIWLAFGVWLAASAAMVHSFRPARPRSQAG